MRVARLLLSLLLLVSAMLGAKAQVFTERLQEVVPGQGRVVLRQSDIITDLVNGASKAIKSVASGETQPQATLENSYDNIELGDQGGQQKRYARSYSVKGYRVQVYSGNNSRTARQEAYSAAQKVKSCMPDVSVYTHFNSPTWQCRVGDFRTYEEASACLHELRQISDFGSAIIISCNVRISY